VTADYLLGRNSDGTGVKALQQASVPAVIKEPHLRGKGEALFTSETKDLKDLTSGIARQWFAVHTCSCQEKRVALHLCHREIEYFLPLSRSVRRWRNGCTMVSEQPLFSGYLFVKIPREERVRVLELPGVHSMVGTGREPIPLPSTEIETLRQGIDLLKVEPCAFLNVGEKARIIRGPLEGLTGIISRKKNGVRLILSLDVIMKSVSVEVNAVDLEPLYSAEEGCGANTVPRTSKASSFINSGFC
jgi:transcription antitermination factor NusG